jgi:hypothetical protein
MRHPELPGLALSILGMGMLAHYTLSPAKTDELTARGYKPGRVLSSPVPLPLAVGWTVMSGGIAWLVAGPRGARA